MEMEVVFYDGTFKSPAEVQYSENKDAIVTISYLFEVNNKLDLQSAGSSPNLTYTKSSARDAIRIL